MQGFPTASGCKLIVTVQTCYIAVSQLKIISYSLGILKIPVSMDYEKSSIPMNSGHLVQPAVIVGLPECPYSFEPDKTHLCHKYILAGFNEMWGMSYNACTELGKPCYAVAVLHTTKHNHL